MTEQVETPAVTETVVEPVQEKRKRKPKAPAKPTAAELAADLEPLPWNAIKDEVVDAYNALLKAVQEGA